MTPEPDGVLPQPGGVRELLQVALPLVISSGSISLMLIVDRIFLTWLSVDALAAAMPAGMMNWTVLSLPLGMAAYANTFVAQYEGAGRRDRVVQSIWQGIYLSLAAGLLLAAVIPLTSRVFSLAGHEEQVRRLEVEYFSILCLGAGPILLQHVLSAFYSGRGKTRVVMVVNIAASLVNAVLDYAMIFGKGPFPAMGMRGAAWATVVANVVACVLFAGLMARNAAREGYSFGSDRRVQWDLVRRFIRFGLPNGVQYLVDIAAYMLFVLFVGRLGTQELAATNLAFSLNSLAFIPMFGMATAVMTLVGRRIGAGEPEIAARSTRTAFALSAVYMFCFSALYLFAPNLLLAPYAMYAKVGSFEEIHPMAVRLLRFVALYGLFDAMASIFGAAVRGAGDTRFSMIVTFAGCWLVMILPTWIVMEHFQGGLYACWAIATANITFLGLAFYLRFRQGRWRTMRVIEETAGETQTTGETQ